jgi:predicted N-acyltransferase
LRAAVNSAQNGAVEHLEARVLPSLQGVAESAWDRLLAPDSTPFLRWAFLEALESGGCAVPERGWLPQHLTLWRGDTLIAAAPAYLKVDSAGDFSRDWGWAGMCQRAGVPYYPKLVLCVPFTPVPGQRVLVAPGEDRPALITKVAEVAQRVAVEEGIPSVHALFHREDEAPAFGAAHMQHRTLFQYHWHNPGFASVDDWLASLNAKRRHQARREMAEPQKQGITLRTVLPEEHSQDSAAWARRTYDLYRTTCERFMWGGTYLTEAFYERIFARMPENLEVVTAWREGELIAGAFNVATPTHLYGRYWGCHEHHRFLHFNVCLYHSIAECIARGRLIFEGGMGGEHKLARSFDPVFVHSSHYFTDPRLQAAMVRVIGEERRAGEANLRAYREARGG